MPTEVKVVSLGAMGVLVFALVSAPIQAATPDALEGYRDVVEEIMRWDGEIEGHDRVLLDSKKGELGLSDQEAAGVEDDVRLELTDPQYKGIN